ncbi:MAG: RHS repeat-associated core domain-containing protein [Acidobacteriota bacterium]
MKRGRDSSVALITRSFNLAMGLSILMSCSAWGITYTGQEVSKVDPANTCSNPPSATSFLTTDPTVYLYFNAATTTDDHLTHDWLAPNGTVLAGGGWNPASGNFCYLNATLALGSYAGLQWLGSWSARVYNNGALLFTVPFTLGPAQAIFNSQVVTKTDPTGTTCAQPTGMSALLNTDTAVYLYFNAAVSSTDHLVAEWLAPDGTIITGKDWGASQPGYYCYPGPPLSIAQYASTPTRLGNWQARVRNNGTVAFTVPFTILAATGSSGPVITSTVLPGGTAGTTYTTTLTASGGTPPYAWSGTALPTGVNLNASTGTLSGTPSAAGNFNPVFTVTDSSSPKLTATVSLSLSIAAPTSSITISSVVNAASIVDGLASGTWIAIRGTNLSASPARIWVTSDFIGNALPTSLDGVRVTVNGRNAYVYYISSTQVNVLAPEDSTTGSIPVQVFNASGASNVVMVNKQSVAPALFTFSQQAGRYAIAQDGTSYAYVGPSGLLGSAATTTPATPGQVLTLYATGLGPTNPAYPGGQIIQTAAPTANTVQVSIGNLPASVQFAGIIAPGLYQLNVVVPVLQTGDASIVVSVSGVQSSSNVFIPIQGLKVLTGPTQTTSYTYDAVGRIASLTYPSGWKVAYTRDAAGQTTSITAQSPTGGSPISVVNNITYQPFGPVSGLKYGNGITEARSFDLDYRLTNLSGAGSKATQNLTYKYDGADNVLSIVDGVTPSSNQQFAYDPLDRLTNASGVYGNFGYTYDGVGNRLKFTNGSTLIESYTYTPKTNRLATIVQAGGAVTQTISYTAAGNISGSSSTSADSYNQAGRLASVTSGGQPLTQLVYNAFGQRSAKTSAAGLRLFEYDRSGHLLEEDNAQGVGITAYIYLEDRPVATIQLSTGKLYFLHDDHRDTPQVATDNTQAVAWLADYEPFGTVNGFTSQTATLGQNLRLPGQEAESETGTYHNGFRDYLPGLGRYLESDPIGLAGGLDGYSYAEGNPETRMDRLGLATSTFGERWRDSYDKLERLKNQGTDIAGSVHDALELTIVGKTTRELFTVSEAVGGSYLARGLFAGRITAPLFEYFARANFEAAIVTEGGELLGVTIDALAQPYIDKILDLGLGQQVFKRYEPMPRHVVLRCLP